MTFFLVVCRDFFSSYTSGSFGCVRMGNEAKCKIIDMGDVELETSIGCKLVLKDVRHVPEMRFSLISIGKFDDEGYHSHLGEGKWKLTKGSLVLARRKKNNTLYKTEARLVKGEVKEGRWVWMSLECWRGESSRANTCSHACSPFFFFSSNIYKGEKTFGMVYQHYKKKGHC